MFVAFFLLLSAQAFRTPVHKKPAPVGYSVVEAKSKLPSNFSRTAEYCIDVVASGNTFCLDLDTGSSDIGIVSTGCRGCPRKTHKPYDPQNSRTANATSCQFCKSHATKSTDLQCKRPPGYTSSMCTMTISYEDESGFSAALFEDQFAFGGAEDKPFSQVVGAIYRAEELTDPRSIDGIIGFAGQSESVANVPNAFKSMVKQWKIEDVFSLCLRTDYGTAYLGAEPGVTDNAKTVYTERLNNSAFYAVGLSDVQVGGKSIGVQPKFYTDGDAIVDSGTSDSCFSDTAFNALKKTFFSFCDGENELPGLCDENGASLDRRGGGGRRQTIFEDRCVFMTEEERMRYPDITTVFADGTKVTHTSAGYLRNDDWLCGDDAQGGDDDGGDDSSSSSSSSSSDSYDDDGEQLKGRGRGGGGRAKRNGYTIAISSCGEDGGGSLLGVSLMTEHVVVFDRANSRIGWLPGYATCP